MQKSLRRITRIRRLAFNFLMLFGIYAAIEAVSLTIVLLKVGSLSANTFHRHAIATQNLSHPIGQHEPPRILHPFIGAVQQPKDDAKTSSTKYRITEFGFFDDDLPIHKRSPERVIVAILGGSVARQFSLSAMDALAEELSQLSEFAGRTFKFVRLASNGYKQPQQLMTINYVLMLGAEFDIVINLDGFNEAVLPGMDNIPFGVFSAYPRDWGKIMAVSTKPEFVLIGGYIRYLRTRQQGLAIWADAFPWRYSPTAQLFWCIRSQQSDSEIIRQMKAMSKFAQQELSYCSLGPPEHFESPDVMYEHCTEIWRRSSILLHQVCKANGIRYFHFLQPNQHVDGSKPIGSEEAKASLDVKSQNSIAIKACYPKMKAEEARLVASGVAYTDLTNVFAEHAEPLYVDTCCHINPTGNLILAKAMGQRIREFVTRGQREHD